MLSAHSHHSFINFAVNVQRAADLEACGKLGYTAAGDSAAGRVRDDVTAAAPAAVRK